LQIWCRFHGEGAVVVGGLTMRLAAAASVAATMVMEGDDEN